MTDKLIMNKQEIQNQIEVLEKELKTLKQKVNEWDNPVRWRAKRGGVYYLINCFGEVCKDYENNSEQDNYRHSIGNYFKTQEEAEKYKENLILKQQLKDITLELNDGVEIDWKSNDRKYYIYFNYANNRVDGGGGYNWSHLGQVYCLSSDFLNIALDRIGEEKLKQLIESGA